LALVVVSRAKTYRRLFGDDHFLEIAKAAARLKAAGVEQLTQTDSDLPSSSDDPRILLTSAGLAIVYTVRQEEAAFRHHCSVGVQRGITANAVGGTFLMYVARLLGLPIERMQFEIGKSTVHHGEVVLDAAQHEALVSARVPPVTASNVVEL